MSKKVQWERMFPDELEAAFAACPGVYFTYGLCEPHGPHNAVGLDSLKAHAIACTAAERFGGIVARPDYWFSVNRNANGSRMARMARMFRMKRLSVHRAFFS